MRLFRSQIDLEGRRMLLNYKVNSILKVEWSYGGSAPSAIDCPSFLYRLNYRKKKISIKTKGEEFLLKPKGILKEW